MAYWLVKSEPETWSWDMHAKKGIDGWTGVRNHQASNNMKAMKKGDSAFFYHSGAGKAVVGLLEVAGEYRPDPTDESGVFGMVDFRAVRPLPAPVTLAAIKAEKTLQNLALVRQPRLSVMPVSGAEWALICKMGGLEREG